MFQCLYSKNMYMCRKKGHQLILRTNIFETLNRENAGWLLGYQQIMELNNDDHTKTIKQLFDVPFFWQQRRRNFVRYVYLCIEKHYTTLMNSSEFRIHCSYWWKLEEQIECLIPVCTYTCMIFIQKFTKELQM